MSRRLVNRGRSSGVNGSATPAPSDLPEYEPLEYVLDEDARRALQELSTNRKQGRFTRTLKAASANLGNAVGDIHERLRERRVHLAKQKQRRRNLDIQEGAEDLQALEEHLDDYAHQVDQSSCEAEATVRLLIDQQVALEDQGDVVADLFTHASNLDAEENTRQLQKARERETAIEIAQANGDPIPPEEEEDDEKGPPPQSTLDSFRQRQADKRAEYEQMTVQQRYALNNEYASFKKLWHDAAEGEDGPPLPDASRWFGTDDQPVLPHVASRTGARGRSRTANQGDDDSDDDIAVAREVTSLRCPLSLREFAEPYSNKKCKHTFEKSAILDYLPQQGEVQCPQTGCSQVCCITWDACFGERLEVKMAMLTWCRYLPEAHSHRISTSIMRSSDDYNAKTREADSTTWTWTTRLVTRVISRRVARDRARGQSKKHKKAVRAKTASTRRRITIVHDCILRA